MENTAQRVVKEKAATVSVFAEERLIAVITSITRRKGVFVKKPGDPIITNNTMIFITDRFKKY
jgi:hypothetical protein